MDIIYVDGNFMDKCTEWTHREMGSAIYNNVKPPRHFTSNTPIVSARKVDVIRAELMDKTRTTTIAAMKVPAQPTTVGFVSEGNPEVISKVATLSRSLLSGREH